MRIIKDHSIAEDHWLHSGDGPLPATGALIVPLARWREEKEVLLRREGDLGVSLPPDTALEEIADDLHHFRLIALEFPVFTDGRSFSLARLLRDRYDFQGEIRAAGDFIRDQLFFLERVGVNAFEFVEEHDLEKALASLVEFTVKYQAASDEPLPLFRRARRPGRDHR